MNEMASRPWVDYGHDIRSLLTGCSNSVISLATSRYSNIFTSELVDETNTYAENSVGIDCCLT